MGKVRQKDDRGLYEVFVSLSDIRHDMNNYLKKLRGYLVRKYVLRNTTLSEPCMSDALIISPHPDDEVFGCGGLIARKKRQGARVSLLMLTEGEGAHLNCCDAPEKEIGACRRKLTLKAGEAVGLGQNDMTWFGLPDGKIPGRSAEGFTQAVERLVTVLQELKPGEVYAPVPFDCWPDHERASQLVDAAIKLYGKPCVSYYYPVWMWHSLRLRDLGRLKGWKRLRLDIRSVQDVKIMAIDHYMSSINTRCGKPVCGELPQGFVQNFLGGDEIFFQREAVSDKS